MNPYRKRMYEVLEACDELLESRSLTKIGRKKIKKRRDEIHNELMYQ